MEKQDLLYEGKSKKVYATNDPARLIVAYKDEKGAVNNHISNAVMRMLEREGVPTHLVRQLSERETVVRRVRMIPLEIIVRNVVAGKLSTLIGQPEGTRLRSPVLEYRYKAASLGNPMINRFHVFALELCTPEMLDEIDRLAFRINKILKQQLLRAGIRLIDCKLEFGCLPDGSIVLADEISPDTSRLWDAETGRKLGKDRFRRDLSNTTDAYQEILDRLERIHCS